MEGGSELSGTFAHCYTISDTEFEPGEYLSGMFEITFGIGIEHDAIKYMLADFYTVTGKGSTTEIPTDIVLVDSLSPCVFTYEVTTEPTCTEPGSATLTCSHGTIVKTEDIPALGHDFELTRTVDQAATCTEESSSSFHCTRCDATTGTITLSVLDHDYVWTYDSEPDCENGGHSTGVCSRCGDTITEDVPAFEHDWGEWMESPAAKCEVDGKKIHTCSRCGKTEEKVIPALEHEWTDWVIVEPTCTEDGTETRTCTLCGKEEVVINEKLGHDWDDGVCIKYPTLTETGIMLFTCQRENCDAAREDIIPTAKEPDAGFDPIIFYPSTEKVVTYVYGEEYSIYYSPYNSSVDDPVTTFLSSNEEVAIVDEYGEVFIKGVGETEISVNYANYVYYDKKTDSYESYVEAIDSYKLIVTPAELTVTVDDCELFYGDDPAGLVFACTYDGFVSFPAYNYYEDESVLEGTLTFSCDYEQYGNVGTYDVTASGLTARNYTITVDPGTLTVNKAKEHTITLGNLEQKRGQTSDVITDIAPQDSTAVITVEYSVDGVWTTTMPGDAGEYVVHASLTSSDRIEVTGEFFTAVLNIKAGATIGGEDQVTGVEIIEHEDSFEVIVPDEALDSIIENVPESGELVIDVHNNAGAAETKDLILPGNLMQTAAESEDVSEVTIIADNTEITMNSKVLNKISSEIDSIREKSEGETTEKISISIDDVSEEDMTAEQKAAVEKMGTDPVLLELSLTITSYDEKGEVVAQEKLHKLGGNVKVRVAYDLGEDMDGTRVVVCYVDEYGTPSYIPATYNNGYVEFTTNHFSFFLICLTEKPLLIGDANDDGNVDEDDLELLQAYFAGKLEDSDTAIANADAADINRNHILDRADAMILARHLAGWSNMADFFTKAE